VIEVTPGGTVNVCAAPVAENVTGSAATAVAGSNAAAIATATGQPHHLARVRMTGASRRR
jgi:hypothetical protein